MKFKILFLILLVSLSCSKNVKIDDNLKKYLNDSSIIGRGKVIELGKSDFRFDYYDPYEKDSHVEFLTSKGYQAGGPSWLGIIYGGLKISEPSILKEIRFDDESDGLVMWSKNKNALIKISRLVAKIKSDNKVLLKCIKVAEDDWKME